MRFCVLVNGAAGSVDDSDDGAQAQAIEEAFAAAGSEAEVSVVAPADFGATMRRIWAGDDRPAAIVVAGGDGTVNCAAGEAAGTDIVLAVLPLGTFNHFAKDLDMPTGLAEAAAALVDGEVRAVDVAEVNGRAFVNNSALGVYPEMVAIRDVIRDQRGWGKVRAVPLAVYRVLRDFPVHRLDLSGPGYQRQRVRTPFVFVGNGVFDNEDGGLVVRDSLSDGQLGVSVARVVSRWKLIATMLRALVAGTGQARDLDVVQLPELTVGARTRRLQVALDGEITWMDAPLHYRCRPGALQVLGPRAPDQPGVREADPVS
ncbi:MAG: diacylglycerol kinase family lipid kinase [Acidimicrobiales bacterium]|nr:diacylglycerol kinase family lipid kinase [Acidimicrobiales bacterium]